MATDNVERVEGTPPPVPRSRKARRPATATKMKANFDEYPGAVRSVEGACLAFNGSDRASRKPSIPVKLIEGAPEWIAVRVRGTDGRTFDAVARQNSHYYFARGTVLGEGWIVPGPGERIPVDRIEYKPLGYSGKSSPRPEDCVDPAAAGRLVREARDAEAPSGA